LDPILFHPLPVLDVTPLQSVSLWAIRCAMALLALGYTLQFLGSRRNSATMAWIGVAGVALASIHVGTAFWAFHSGSHTLAFESTADRTEALLGIRAGHGIYVNYVFVGVWWMDTALRGGWLGETSKWLQWGIDLFLIAMAIFGSVIFAEGPIRFVGLGVIALWIGLGLARVRHVT
jgi:hypothetical protein